MATKYYRAHFQWFLGNVKLSEGDLNILANYRRFEVECNTAFMDAYSKGVKILHKHFKEWNKEFESVYGEKPNWDLRPYKEFICRRQNEILRTAFPDGVFELFTDPDFGECSICGRLRRYFNGDMRVQLEFEAV